MAYQIKQSIVRILTITTALIGYSIYLYNTINLNSLTNSEFGKYLFLTVPIMIVTEILGKMIFETINYNQKDQDSNKGMDEFERIIEYKSVRNFALAFSFGFFLAMLLLWLVAPLSTVFIILYLSIFLSGYVLQTSYIIYYSKGV